MLYSPIVIFAFNRPVAVKNTVASLQRNPESKDSDLYIFVDGPRIGRKDEEDKVNEVRNFVKNISGFKSLHYSFSERNRGLAESVINGVTEVLNQYGSVIVVEDDLVLMPNFLNYMNQGLARYKDDNRVMSVCGHSCKVTPPKGYPFSAYFFTRSSSWGWGTWKNRWEGVDWQLNDWTAVEANRKSFVQSQGSDVFKMLRDWKYGKNHSWAIRFCYAQYVTNRLSVIPCKSFVNNNGFDGDGTNCKRYSRFKFELDEREERLSFVWPTDVRLNSSIYRQAKWYHSIPLRIWSRVMYMIK